ncbi:MAG TPA: NF038122 family metalloprotease, partial [Planctomycetaceae bacterium]|nr:NF038122 family metalloprotease [Planctomycetaceae bacterium]
MTRAAWLQSVFRALTGPTLQSEPRAARRVKPSSLPAEIRLLEARTLLSGLAVEQQATTSALSPVFAEEFNTGAVITRTRTDASQARVIAPGEGSLRPGTQLSGNGLQFNLVAAPAMSQQAIDGFQEAADLWSSILRDDIMVNIDIDFTVLGTGILGSTGSTSQGNNLTSVRNALTADAKSLSDASAVANLPSGSTLSLYTSNPTTGAAELDNNATGNNSTLDINTANAKAIGLLSASNSASDGSITFSSLFTWDFDRSDGIAQGAFDFVGVAAHEIGHLLGFVSGADVVDATSHNGSSAPLSLDPFRVVSTLDLFRYSSASETAGADIDVRADTATKYFSIDGGATQLTTFSTGSANGDGRQCSHWKDNLNIGIMDPTAAPAEYTDITNFDVQAFDVMGWDVAMDQGDSPDTGSGTGTGNYSTNLADNGPRHLLFSASGSITDPSGAPKVYLGAGVTGELAALQNSTATGDVDNGITSLPALVPGTTQNFTVTSTG